MTTVVPPAATTPPTPARPRGAWLFYVVALIATLVSINTSWRYFGEILGVTDEIERASMFAVLEITLVACGVAMRAGVRSPSGRPGPAQVLAWGICGAAGYMAIQVSGVQVGIARVVLGPALAIIALHLALGIEVRVRRGQSSGTWARIARELRERLLSRLGLADDQRDALARTRDRAADRAARLATSWSPLRMWRLGRAVRAAGVALDATQRGRMLAQVATLRHLDDLLELDCPSPWSLPAAPDDARDLTEADRIESLPEAPVSPAAPADLTAVSRTAAVAWAHLALGPHVPAGRIVAYLADHGVSVSESLVYKARRAAADLGGDMAALVIPTGEYPALTVVPAETPAAPPAA